MKHLKNILFLFILVNSIAVFSQEVKPQKPLTKIRTTIKGNPLSMLVGVIPFTAEYRLLAEYTVAKNQATQIGFSYLSKSPFFSLYEASAPTTTLNLKWKMYGFRVQAWHKFYIAKFNDKHGDVVFIAPNGFYLAPQVSFSTVQMTNRYFQFYDIYIRATHFNANILFGGQLFLGNIAIDIFTGVGYKKNEWIERYAPNKIITIDPKDMGFSYAYSRPFKFTLGFNIGYGF